MTKFAEEFESRNGGWNGWDCEIWI